MSGLFDLEYHEKKIREYQPPLIKLNSVINWELFRETIETALYVEPKGAGGSQNLAKLNWSAINAKYWMGNQDTKQAEFLCENSFDWSLVQRIGVLNQTVYQQVLNIIKTADHKPIVEIKNEWYY